MSVSLLKPAPKVPNDLSENLRELADAVDRGEIESFISVFVRGGNYEFHFASSLSDSLVLASILDFRCKQRMLA